MTSAIIVTAYKIWIIHIHPLDSVALSFEKNSELQTKQVTGAGEVFFCRYWVELFFLT